MRPGRTSISAMDRPHERPTVLVTYDPPAGERAVISETLGDGTDVHFLSDLDAHGRTLVLASADALLSWSPGRDLQPGELTGATRLRLLQLLSAGADTVDFATVPDDVIVAANVGAYAQPMAEHVLGMALALAKRLPANHARLAAGEYPADPETSELRGAVAGIVGFGGIGRACADLLRPRACASTRSTRRDTPTPTSNSRVAPGDLERVLRASDVVVVAIPLTRDTRGLIGARELTWMKPTAVLINVARAAVIDEAALYDHLVASPRFSAGIDVWWDEPERGAAFHPRFPFLDLPNVLGSPHNSGIVPGMMERAAGDAARNVARFLAASTRRGASPRGLLVFGEDGVRRFRVSPRICRTRSTCSGVPGLGHLLDGAERLEHGAAQVHGAGVGPARDLVPRGGLGRATLGLDPSVVGQRVALAAVGLLDRHQALVLEHLQRRVHRARTGLPHTARPLAQLTNDLVAVHGPLGEQGDDGRPYVAAASPPAVPVRSAPATHRLAPRSAAASSFSLEVVFLDHVHSFPYGSKTITIYRELPQQVAEGRGIRGRTPSGTKAIGDSRDPSGQEKYGLAARPRYDARASGDESIR